MKSQYRLSGLLPQLVCGMALIALAAGARCEEAVAPEKKVKLKLSQEDGKISVQSAVMMIANQVGLAYDWKASFENTNPTCRRLIRPDIENATFDQAMKSVLEPVGLTYKVEANRIVLLKAGAAGPATELGPAVLVVFPKGSQKQRIAVAVAADISLPDMRAAFASEGLEVLIDDEITKVAADMKGRLKSPIIPRQAVGIGRACSSSVMVVVDKDPEAPGSHCCLRAVDTETASVLFSLEIDGKVVNEDPAPLLGFMRTAANAAAPPTTAPAAASAPSVRSGEMKLALIEGRGEEAVSEAVVAKLEVALSNEKGLGLVERAEVKRILAEQALALSGLVEGNKAATVGKLLGADALVLLERQAPQKTGGEEAGRTCRIRVVEAGTGVVLRSLMWPEERLVADVTPAVVTASSAAAKWRAGPAGRCYVAILSFRSEEPGVSLGGVADALKAFLLSDLADSPQVVVLEREQMQRLTEERDLTGAELELRTSAILLDGGVRRSPKDGTLTITVSVKAGAEKPGEAIRVSGAQTQMPELRRSLASAVLPKLGASAAKRFQMDPRLEASVFLDRAGIYLGHGEIENACQAIEACLALNPSESNRRAAVSLWTRMTYAYDSMVRDAGPEQRYAVLRNLFRIWARRHNMETELCLGDIARWRKGEAVDLKSLRFETPFTHFGWDIDTDAIAKTDAEAAASLAEIRDTCVRRYEASLPFFDELRTKTGESKYMDDVLLDALRRCREWTDDPKVWTAMFRDALRRIPAWAKPDARMNADEGFRLASALYDLKVRSGRPGDSLRIRSFTAPEELALVAEIDRQLSEHKDPLFRFTYHAIRMVEAPDTAEASARKALDILLTEMPIGHPYMAPNPQLFMRDEVSRALSTLERANPDACRQYGSKLFDPMLKPECAELVLCWNDQIYNWAFTLCRLGKAEDAQRVLSAAGDALVKGEVSGKSAEQRKKQALALLDHGRKLVDKQLGRPAVAAGNDPEPPAAWSGFEVKSVRTGVSGRPKAIAVSQGRLIAAYAGDNVRQSDRAFLRAGCIPLAGGREESLGWVEVEKDAKENVDLRLAVDGDDVYVGGRHLLVLARFSGRQATVWTEKDGVPASFVTAIGCLGGKVYLGTGAEAAAAGAGTFLELDPATGKAEMVCSSRTVQKRTPLDGGSAYSVTAIVPDPARKCLWLGVSADDDRSGVWQYSPSTRTLKPVGRRRIKVKNLRLAGERLLLHDGRSLTMLDPATGDTVSSPGYWPALLLDDGRIVTGGSFGTVAPAIRQDIRGKEEPLAHLPNGFKANFVDVLEPCEEGFLMGVTSRNLFWIIRPGKGEGGEAWEPATSGYSARKFSAWEDYFRGGQLGSQCTDCGNELCPTRQEALKILDRAAQAMPDSYEIFMSRGSLYARVLNWEAAAADFSKAHELVPTLDSLLRLREALHMKGDMAGALRCLEQMLAMDPTHEGARYQLEEYKGKLSFSDADRAALGEKYASKMVNLKAAAIVRGLTGSDSVVHTRAREEMAMGGSGTGEALAVVIRMLSDPVIPLKMRGDLSYDICPLGPRAKGSSEALLSLLRQNEDVGARRVAAHALGEIGPDAAAAAPSLVAVLGDADIDVRRCAANALGKLGNPCPGAIEGVEGLLRDSSVEVRIAAALAHWRLTSKTDKAMPVLIDILGSKDAGNRLTAANAIGEMGPAASSAVQSLMRAMSSSSYPGDFSVSASARALGRIGAAAKPAVPALEAAMAAAVEPKDPDLRNYSLRAGAAFALWQIRGDAQKALDVLVPLLQNEEPSVRECALITLGDMGPEANSAVPSIKGTEGDEYGRVQRRVAEALRKIEGTGP